MEKVREPPYKSGSIAAGWIILYHTGGAIELRQHLREFKMTELELYEILNAPGKTKRNIAVTKVQMEKLRITMLPSAIRYDKDSVQASPKDTMPIFAEKIEKLDKKVKRLEKQYMEQYENAEKLIDRLENKYRGVLKLKYLANCRPKEIAQDLNYAESYVYKLHKDAIKILKRG